MTDDINPSNLPGEATRPESLSQALRSLLNPFTLFILIALACFAFLMFYGLTGRDSRGTVVPSSSFEKNANVKNMISTLEESSGTRQVTATSGVGVPAANEHDAAHEPGTSLEQDRFLKQEVMSLTNQIYEDLRKEETITTHTFFLESGDELKCDLLNDMGTHWKIKHDGMTAIIAKDRVESIKSRTPQSVEMELRKIAHDQATQIILGRLVGYEGDWITPEERDMRIHVAKTEAEIQKLEAQKRAGIPIGNAGSSTMSKPTIGGKVRSDSSTITVVAGFGLDDIVVGDPRRTKEFIKSRLGVPDAEKPQVLDYDHKYGMKFIMSSDGNMLVEIHLSPRFEGKVLPDISMSSSLQDIFEAYGQPVEEKTADSIQEPYYKYKNRTLYRAGHLGRLAYRDLGLLFSFKDDRITQIIIHRK